MSKKLFDSINEILVEFNKFRSPEVTAKLIRFNDGKLMLEFKGSFCNTCGFHDYFEDFIYEMKRLRNVELHIEQIRENGFQKFVVTYSTDDLSPQ